MGDDGFREEEEEEGVPPLSPATSSIAASVIGATTTPSSFHHPTPISTPLVQPHPVVLAHSPRGDNNNRYDLSSRSSAADTNAEISNSLSGDNKNNNFTLTESISLNNVNLPPTHTATSTDEETLFTSADGEDDREDEELLGDNINPLSLFFHPHRTPQQLRRSNAALSPPTLQQQQQQHPSHHQAVINSSRPHLTSNPLLGPSSPIVLLNDHQTSHRGQPSATPSHHIQHHIIRADEGPSASPQLKLDNADSSPPTPAMIEDGKIRHGEEQGGNDGRYKDQKEEEEEEDQPTLNATINVNTVEYLPPDELQMLDEELNDDQIRSSGMFEKHLRNTRLKRENTLEELMEGEPSLKLNDVVFPPDELRSRSPPVSSLRASTANLGKTSSKPAGSLFNSKLNGNHYFHPNGLV